MNHSSRRARLGIGIGLGFVVYTAAAAHPAAADDVRLLVVGQTVASPLGNDPASPAHTADSAHSGAEALTECALLPVPSNGQKEHKPKWWSSAEGRAEFGLTEAQSRELEAVFQQVLPEMRTHKADVDRYQQQLTKLLNEASAKESVVVKAIEQLEAAQSALGRTRTIMLYRMYRLLSPEQRAKVQAYYDRKAKEPGSQSAHR